MEEKNYNYNIFDVIYVMEDTVKYFKSNEVLIKSIKGNIPVNYNVFNKYKNVSEIFDGEMDKANYYIINTNANKIIDLNEKANKINAKLVFHRYHKTNVFYNNGIKIHVTNAGLDESVHKMMRVPTQRKYFNIYIHILSNLGQIIKRAKLVNQSSETKSRNKYVYWNYYLINLKMGEDIYICEFDIVSMDNGENHYRVCRIKKIDIFHGDIGNQISTLAI